MSPLDEDAARIALRERLGNGARYDSPAAPAAELSWARLGTAYFARKLNELSVEDLDRVTRVPGWKRRHIVAQIGFHARALARLIEAARQRRDTEKLAEPEAQNEDVAFGATLPDHALRYLFQHAAIHLNVEWRDLDPQGWLSTVRRLSGTDVTIQNTPWLRARAIWIGTVDLGSGGSFLDFPGEMIDRLLSEMSQTPRLRESLPSRTLQPSDRPTPVLLGGGGPVVAGRAADLLAWLVGRGASRLAFEAETPQPPLWPAEPDGLYT